MAAHVQNNLETFLARRQQVLDLEATTHRMESSLDSPSIPGLRFLRLASEDWQQQASLKPLHPMKKNECNSFLSHIPL